MLFRSRDNQTAENIFLFRKLAFPENMYFPENVLQQPNTALIIFYVLDIEGYYIYIYIYIFMLDDVHCFFLFLFFVFFQS